MHHFIRYTLKLLVLSSMLAYCSGNSSKNKNFGYSQAITSLADSSANDTLFVDRQAAVFIEPDSIRIERVIKQYGEEDFYTAADDYLYFLSIANRFLDSVKLTRLTATDKKFVKFFHSDKPQLLRIEELPHLWSIYFFDPPKKAREVDITSIHEEYEIYFKQ